jgi:hypothetical protein
MDWTIVDKMSNAQAALHYNYETPESARGPKQVICMAWPPRPALTRHRARVAPPASLPPVLLPGPLQPQPLLRRHVERIQTLHDVLGM